MTRIRRLPSGGRSERRLRPDIHSFGGDTMRIVQVAIVLPLLTVAFPFACAGPPQTLGFLPSNDAGKGSDVVAAPDKAATTFDAQGVIQVIHVDGGPSPSGSG